MLYTILITAPTPDNKNNIVAYGPYGNFVEAKNIMQRIVDSDSDLSGDVVVLNSSESVLHEIAEANQ